MKATNEQILNRIRELSADGTMITQSRWNGQRGDDMPNVKIVVAQIGKWNNIAKTLGLKANKNGRGGYFNPNLKKDRDREAKVLQKMRKEMSTPKPRYCPNPNPEFCNPAFLVETHRPVSSASSGGG